MFFVGLLSVVWLDSSSFIFAFCVDRLISTYVPHFLLSCFTYSILYLQLQFFLYKLFFSYNLVFSIFKLTNLESPNLCITILVRFCHSFIFSSTETNLHLPGAFFHSVKKKKFVFQSVMLFLNMLW